MRLTRSQNVLHFRVKCTPFLHKMFKIASASGAPPHTPLGELTTLQSGEASCRFTPLVSGDENGACFTAMEAGMTITFTAMEAGITNVITATYTVMLAVLSSSCNEETRTRSEG